MSALDITQRWDYRWPILLPWHPRRYVRTLVRENPTQHVLAVRGDDRYAPWVMPLMCGNTLGRARVTIRPDLNLRQCYYCTIAVMRAERALSVYGYPEGFPLQQKVAS